MDSPQEGTPHTELHFFHVKMTHDCLKKAVLFCYHNVGAGAWNKITAKENLKIVGINSECSKGAIDSALKQKEEHENNNVEFSCNSLELPAH